MQQFSSRIINWQLQHGRHALPWQSSRDPYRIWLSEIMLQQTQVASVIPYFLRFTASFPNVHALARASEDAVLALWSGLGYYSRARNLHLAARQIVEKFAGIFPCDADKLLSLPGVGRSTAGAIAALAFGQRQAILDGNVKRVLARHAGENGWPGDKLVENRLWTLAQAHLPSTGIAAYTQGMMDLGAGVCTRNRPRCDVCPIAMDCIALKEARVSELPSPRPPKALPEKEVQMLMLLTGGQILLERRPSRGIWGGLWSFPEIPRETDPVFYCQTHLDFAVSESASLPMLKHGFTHFHLRIFPTLVRIAPPSANSDTSQRRWLTQDRWLAMGLPAPVRKLLLQL